MLFLMKVEPTLKKFMNSGFNKTPIWSVAKYSLTINFSKQISSNTVNSQSKCLSSSEEITQTFKTTSKYLKSYIQAFQIIQNLV